MTVFAPLTDKDYEGLRRTLRSLQVKKSLFFLFLLRLKEQFLMRVLSDLKYLLIVALW